MFKTGDIITNINHNTFSHISGEILCVTKILLYGYECKILKSEKKFKIGRKVGMCFSDENKFIINNL